MEETRRDHDRRIVAGLTRQVASGGRVLDIGCGYGWFLLQAQRAGYVVEGIEPEPVPAEMARRSGISVREGLFPGVLDPGDRFDAIAMHHVVEHIPDPRSALIAARRALRPEGVLLLSIPCADGPIFRTAVGSARGGWDAPLRRMFQFGFPSPHLWYFPRGALVALLARSGFQPVDGEWMPSVLRTGLWSRISYGSGRGPMAVATLLSVGMSAPLLARIRPTDTLFVVARAVE